MILTSKPIKAEAGLKSGLVDAVVAPDQLLPAAKARALDMASQQRHRPMSLYRCVPERVLPPMCGLLASTSLSVWGVPPQMHELFSQLMYLLGSFQGLWCSESLVVWWGRGQAGSQSGSKRSQVLLVPTHACGKLLVPENRPCCRGCCCTSTQPCARTPFIMLLAQDFGHVGMGWATWVAAQHLWLCAWSSEVVYGI